MTGLPVSLKIISFEPMPARRKDFSIIRVFRILSCVYTDQICKYTLIALLGTHVYSCFHKVDFVPGPPKATKVAFTVRWSPDHSLENHGSKCNRPPYCATEVKWALLWPGRAGVEAHFDLWCRENFASLICKMNSGAVKQKCKSRPSIQLPKEQTVNNVSSLLW